MNRDEEMKREQVGTRVVKFEDSVDDVELRDPKWFLERLKQERRKREGGGGGPQEKGGR